MFNGITFEIGEITKVEDSKDLKKVWIQAPQSVINKLVGASISVDGICSTITEIKNDSFSTQYMPESLEKTTAGAFVEGKKVNLETSIKFGDPIDGHLVQGHVDCVVKVLQFKKDGNNVVLTIEMPNNLMKFTAIKGSITINGVALTISHIEQNAINVSLIPHTLEQTNLGELKTGDLVNIEIDMLARYLKSLLDNKEGQITYEFLRERNFL